MLIGTTCASDVIETQLALDHTALKAEVDNVPVGITRFELAILNANAVELGDATLQYTVMPGGPQTLPSTTIQLNHRQRQDLAFIVPLMGSGRGGDGTAWSNYVGNLLGSACGTRHDGTGTLDSGKMFNVKAYPLTDAAGVSMHDLTVDVIRRAGLAEGAQGRMPPTGPGLNSHHLTELQAWLDGGNPKDPPPGGRRPDASGGEAGLGTVAVDIQEMWDAQLVPGVTTVRLPRGDQGFTGVATLIADAKYQMTYRLLGPNDVLLKTPPEAHTHIITTPALTETLDYHGLSDQRNVVIPIVLQPN